MKTKTLFSTFILFLFFLVGCSSEKEHVKDQVVDIHNSMISVDWAGTYEGILPCADCEGIKTALILNKDLTYELFTLYLGKSNETFQSSGTFIWDDKGTNITLINENSEWNQQYKVGENKLFHLDKDGNRIDGNFADMYKLSKLNIVDIHNSMISLDWAGTYEGILPCADCEGIKTALILNEDLTYKLFTLYLGKSNETFQSSGTFVWDYKGSNITLVNEKGEWNQQYKVGENKLFHLDKDGNKIDGNFADMYKLSKLEIVDIHNSMISGDWAGTYQGTLPCADCEGIKTTLILNEDLTYRLFTFYLGKSNETFQSSGTFVWDYKGSNITLVNEKGEWNQQYMVGQNKLFHLDKDGNRIDGNFADMYKLSKLVPGIREKYWKLVELMGKEIIRNEKMSKEPHIIFKDSDNRVTGHTGCNSFSGNYEIKEGNRLGISKVVKTQMACLDMTVEDEFVRVINSVDSYLVKDDTLFFYRAKMAPLARFEAVYFQ
jgi:uncharacterized lipoprotein NlpE involved in copper resistance/heat shock protein HslJ